MSWSVAATGKAEAVKRSLAVQFDNAKKSTVNIPHEHDSVIAIEKIVNDQLDFLIAMSTPKAIVVNAAGSAWKGTGPDGSTQVKLEVTPIYNFVE